MDESAHEKVERYRRMADSTRELAARTEDPAIRAAYLDLAEKWVKLADETAQEVRTSSPRSGRSRRDADQPNS
jgi:hypothetical protein